MSAAAPSGSMQAIVCRRLGDPSSSLGPSGVLELSSVPCPPIKPGHVRVRVAAASLNFPDALQVQVAAYSCACASLLHMQTQHCKCG